MTLTTSTTTKKSTYYNGTTGGRLTIVDRPPLGANPVNDMIVQLLQLNNQRVQAAAAAAAAGANANNANAAGANAANANPNAQIPPLFQAMFGAGLPQMGLPGGGQATIIQIGGNNVQPGGQPQPPAPINGFVSCFFFFFLFSTSHAVIPF